MSNPKHDKTPYKLTGDFRERIRTQDLHAALFPNSVALPNGKTVTKPQGW